jgi:hypothetical protein
LKKKSNTKINHNAHVFTPKNLRGKNESEIFLKQNDFAKKFLREKIAQKIQQKNFRRKKRI